MSRGDLVWRHTPCHDISGLHRPVAVFGILEGPRGKTEPHVGFDAVLADTSSRVVHVTEGELGVAIPLFSRQSKPPRRLGCVS